MDKRLFWRAALVFAAVVAIEAGILIALPLSHDFFDDYGIVAGPLAWVIGAVVTALILKLPWSLALFAAAAGGVCAVLVDIAGAKHWIAPIVGIAVFAACCGGYETAQREMAESEAGTEPERDKTPSAP
jgi:hypothetical protein